MKCNPLNHRHVILHTICSQNVMSAGVAAFLLSALNVCERLSRRSSGDLSGMIQLMSLHCRRLLPFSPLQAANQQL